MLGKTRAEAQKELEGEGHPQKRIDEILPHKVLIHYTVFSTYLVSTIVL